MNPFFEPYLAAALAIGGICGLESKLAGRKLAVATHIVAAIIGYYGLEATDMVGAASLGLSWNILYVLAGLFLACAWIAETDSLRSLERREDRGDASNHVVAFVVGLGCAMRCDLIVIAGCAEMLALFMRRARADFEPAYLGGGSVRVRGKSAA